MANRPLADATLKDAAKFLAGQFFLPSMPSKSHEGRFIGGSEYVYQELYNYAYKDEFEQILAMMKRNLGVDAVAEFEAQAKKRFSPRSDEVFAKELEERLAMRPDGTLIAGKVGSVCIGEVYERDDAGRYVYRHKTINTRKGPVTIAKRKKRRVYAGEEKILSLGAFNMNVSAESIILGLDAIVDNLDEGTGAAVIEGRSGAQPADPDAVVTGTRLFTLVMSDPAFGAAADQADGTVDAAASAITDDSSADATGTLGYCRVSATNDGATPLDDHIDGEAGTSGADFNFNTLSIVTGATVSMSSYVITFDQGTTAT